MCGLESHTETKGKDGRKLWRYPRGQILQFLQERGDSDQAAQADQELPDQVDTDQDAGLLSKFGIDPQELISKFGGGLGGVV
jgi:hypothetical protein